VGFEISKFTLCLFRDNLESAKIDQKLIFQDPEFFET
jgi:hypothetical protein